MKNTQKLYHRTTCPDCNGTGIIRVPEFPDDPDSQEIEDNCPRCFGDGDVDN